MLFRSPNRHHPTTSPPVHPTTPPTHNRRWDPSNVTVVVNGSAIPPEDVRNTNGDSIIFNTPPGAELGGEVDIVVQSGDRESNPVTFAYQPGESALHPV